MKLGHKNTQEMKMNDCASFGFSRKLSAASTKRLSRPVKFPIKPSASSGESVR